MYTQKHDKDGSAEHRGDKTKVITCPYFKLKPCIKSMLLVSESRSLLCIGDAKHAVPSFLYFGSFIIELW